MSQHIYKKIELTGSSPNSIEEAVNAAITRASKTVHSLRWFEVCEIRGDITKGSVAHWQVTVKIGFTLDEGASAGGKETAHDGPGSGKPEID